MSGFTIEYQTKKNGLVIIECGNVKYWEGEGLPTYEGGLEGFETMYPSVVNELLEKGILRRVS